MISSVWTDGRSDRKSVTGESSADDTIALTGEVSRDRNVSVAALVSLVAGGEFCARGGLIMNLCQSRA